MNISTYFIPRSFNKIYTHTLQIFKNFIETNLDWISRVTSHSICIHYFITSILMSFDFRGHLWPIRPFDGNSNVQNKVIDVSENVWLASFIDCGFFFFCTAEKYSIRHIHTSMWIWNQESRHVKSVLNVVGWELGNGGGGGYQTFCQTKYSKYLICWREGMVGGGGGAS